MAHKTEIAQDLKDFLALNTIGVLSTWSKKHPDYPFGSLVLYDIDSTGRIIIFISNISEHYRNLIANPKSCLYVPEAFASIDPQAFTRLAVLTDFHLLPDSELEPIELSYFKRFPDAVDRRIAHSFVFFRATAREIRWIGGFGSMGWINGEELAAAELDSVAYNSASIISHMNQDHQPALADFVRTFSDLDPGGKTLLMASANARGFSILLVEQNRHQKIHVPLKRTVDSKDEFRKVIIEMLKDCRGA